jgi:hypothetical protein
MLRVPPPERRYYGGQIDLGAQPIAWIKTHSFSSRELIESQVRYGEWKRDFKAGRYCFYMKPTIPEGRRSVKVIIKFRLFTTHVLVYHTHCL